MTFNEFLQLCISDSVDDEPTECDAYEHEYVNKHPIAEPSYAECEHCGNRFELDV